MKLQIINLLFIFLFRFIWRVNGTVAGSKDAEEHKGKLSMGGAWDFVNRNLNGNPNGAPPPYPSNQPYPLPSPPQGYQQPQYPYPQVAPVPSQPVPTYHDPYAPQQKSQSGQYYPQPPPKYQDPYMNQVPYTIMNRPSPRPTPLPTANPTPEPTPKPTFKPTLHPTPYPTQVPVPEPSASPTQHPTEKPTPKPTPHPTDKPSLAPSVSLAPSAYPTETQSPSEKPSLSQQPSEEPTLSKVPSSSPSISFQPTQPSEHPTQSASPSSTPSLSDAPSESPSESLMPSSTPSDLPSVSVSPSSMPSDSPSRGPSLFPSAMPSNRPSEVPSFVPSGSPSDIPSVSLSPTKSNAPSSSPSAQPSSYPSELPSENPSPRPTSSPTKLPTIAPTTVPTASPTSSPTKLPTLAPTIAPVPPPPIVIIIIIINFNIFNPVIGFELTDANNNIIANAPVGALPASDNSLLQQVELIQGAEYTFTIISSSQEIMAAENGFYSVSLDGTELVSGGANFGNEESTTFSASIPPIPVESGSVVVLIILNFDVFTPNIGFQISDSDNNIVASVPTGTFSTAVGSVVHQVELDFGNDYTFTIFASSRDAMAAEDGSYSVIFDGEILVSGTANFGRQESKSFSIRATGEESRIESPTGMSPEVPELTIADLEERPLCSILAKLECKSGGGGKCLNMTVPTDCPPEGIMERIVFRYSIENDGSKEVKITKAESHLIGGQAVEYLDHLETNPIPSQVTSLLVASGEVMLNICFPIEVSNLFEIEGITSDGLTCNSTAFSSFSVNPST
ncbi:laminin G domain containing protein [Nitzschia inconspicua]|uniref:Laminin G domain containing protein n=1 Tax=Nitzschia inconspicua TaxID=303405 RepID=A0A9K3M509_9STRA|nr:laminin G domain containing protein [Nitzschia inconspicua]